MMTKLLICLLTTVSLLGEIVEIKNFHEISNHIQENTLLIYDIDNTLIELNQLLGCDQWFNYKLKKHQKAGMEFQRALETTLNEWEAIQHLTSCRPVEPSTPYIVADAQERFQSICLTSRGLALASRTIQLLKEAGFDLSKNSITDSEIHFMCQNEGILFRKGILFTAGRDKGESLKKLLQACDFVPERVLFVDDKQNQLLSVERFCEEAHIPFVGLRYGFLDEKVANFDEEVAEIQWAHFGKILSDEEAKETKIP